MKTAVQKALEHALAALGMEIPAHIEIGSPKDESMGDLATPVAMSLAKTLKRKPRDIAEDIVRRIPKDGIFEKIEVAGAGFINFTFSSAFLSSSLKTLLKEKAGFLRSDIGKGRKVQIEFVSANPTGPLHLGHGRGAAVGGALSNLLSAAGWSVEREYYINDAGRQARLLGESVFARYKELLGIEYPFPEDGYRGQYVVSIAEAAKGEAGSRYKDAGFEEAGDFFTDFAVGMMLKVIKEDLQAFGIRFDTWRSERGLYENGEVAAALDYLKAKGHLYEEEGALWFKATAFGDEKDRVVRKSNGEHTYFASDIAYHKKKIDSGFDELIDIWGADHHGYIRRLEAVIEALGYDRKKLRVFLIQMVSLMRGGTAVQMSKRAGEFVTLREVMEEVGADITKFIFLTRRPDSHLEFDLEAAKAASSENPVYYIQYANARIHSIFVHAREKGMDLAHPEDADFSILSSPEETRLIKKLLSYPMAFEAAARAHEPHRITFYLQELATFFHQFYNKHRVVTDDEGLTLARLSLCEAVRTVLKDGLEILGVTAPDRM
ncbi:MAG: arginine--tRNA ligase [Thermodesulfovibrionales bacterium]|nr:arginine--tRNA ligase [Thermodesulfovibrionales bacterium]